MDDRVMTRPTRIVAERGGRILAFSDALLDLCGIDPERAPPTQLGEIFPELLSLSLWRELFDGREPRVSTTTRLSLPTGLVVEVSIDAKLVVDEGGRPPIVVLTLARLDGRPRASPRHERRPRPPLAQAAMVASRRSRRRPARRTQHQRRPGLKRRPPKRS